MAGWLVTWHHAVDCYRGKGLQQRGTIQTDYEGGAAHNDHCFDRQLMHTLSAQLWNMSKDEGTTVHRVGTCNLLSKTSCDASAMSPQVWWPLSRYLDIRAIRGIDEEAVQAHMISISLHPTDGPSTVFR